jgi:TolB-like protein/DNA-binding winged helix-turn-helix (wHTH) protein
MSEKPKLFYEFGSFRLDEKERRLWRDGEEVTFKENGRTVRLPPKAFDLLLLLVKQSGQMIGRDELMERIWPGTFVEDNRLSDNISTLRKFLNDRPRNPQFIETVPKHGYRFVADVREMPDETVAVLEETKARIVIEEDGEQPAVDAPEASGHDFRERAVAPALPAASTPRRRNTLRSVALACLLFGGLALAAYFAVRNKSGQPTEVQPLARSIAVLPFKPLVLENRDPALELGMTDALITKLSNIREVIVRPTSAVLKYNDPAQDPLAAGREQGVDVLLDGKVQRAGDRVRVTVQLVRVSDGVPLWGREFDESFTNIFSVQNSISEQVARALTLHLSSDEQKRLTNRYTEKIEAYQLYLQGRHFMEKRTPEDLRKALNYYQQAIEVDANYALAYSGLAYAYHLLAFYGGLPPTEAYPPAKRAALRALELDPALPEAYTALARIKEGYEHDASGAAEDYRRAIEINPSHASARRSYSAYLLRAGRIDEAIREAQKAQEIDPLLLIANANLGEIYYYAHQWDQTLKYMRRVREIDPTFQKRYVGTYLFLSYMRKGMYEEAIQENARRLSDGAGPEKEAEVVATLTEAHRVSGERGIWQKQIELAEKLQKSDSDFPFFMAEAHIHLGEKDQTLRWLNKAANEKHPAIAAIHSDPDYESLRSDPRFAELVRRVATAK